MIIVPVRLGCLIRVEADVETRLASTYRELMPLYFLEGRATGVTPSCSSLV
jgi:hypothetical protein